MCWLIATVITASLWHIAVFIQLDATADSISLAVLLIYTMQLIFADKYALPCCWALHHHTHTRLTALCTGPPGWAGTRKVKPSWILLKQETVSGSRIRLAICKSAPRSRQITMPAPHCSIFYRPDALPDAQPTVSKHWRNPLHHHKLHNPVGAKTITWGAAADLGNHCNIGSKRECWPPASNY